MRCLPAQNTLICSAYRCTSAFGRCGTPCWRVSSRLPPRFMRYVRRSHYSCDILLITGRPGCLPGVQALIRHLQPVPVNRIVWLDKYQVHEWYPFSQQGRIGNPKSTAAVGAMLCNWRWIFVCRVLTLKQRISARTLRCAIWACWITRSIPCGTRTSGITISTSINPARNWTPVCTSAARQRYARLPAAGQCPLARDTALYPEHQLCRAGESHCGRRRTERAPEAAWRH